MKRIILTGIFVVVAGVAGFMFTPAYRHLMVGRLLRAAEGELARQHYDEAERFYRLALKRDVNDLRLLHSYADFLDAKGSPEVLAVRLRIIQLDPGDVKARLDGAETALKMRKVIIARRLLANPTAAVMAIPRYYDLAGWMQYLSFDLADADAVWTAALEKTPGNKIYEANQAMVRLAATDESVRKAAMDKLVEIALGDAPPLSALASIMTHATQSPAEPEKLDQLLERFHALVPPESPFFTSYLDAIHRWRPGQFQKALAEYCVKVAAEPDAALAAQGWMVTAGHYEEFLAFRQSLPAPLRENFESILLEAEALFDLRRMDALDDLLKQPVWNNVKPLKMAIQERIRRALLPQDDGYEIHAAKWNAILAAANKNEVLLAILTRMAFTWGWQDEYALSLWATADAVPSAEPDMLENLFQFYVRAKDARSVRRVLVRQLQLQPGNPGLQNNFAFLSFLLGIEADKAGRMIDGLCASHTGVPLFISTRAFGLLKAGKPELGLALFKQIDVEKLRGTAPGVCYGYLLAATGDPRAAEYLEGAEKWVGFPEEIEMIKQARKQTGQPAP